MPHYHVDPEEAADLIGGELPDHGEGIFLCEKIFGVTLTYSDGPEGPCASPASSTSRAPSAGCRPSRTG